VNGNHLFDQLLGRHKNSDRPFARLPDGTGQSYRELFDRTTVFAWALKNHGVIAGDRVTAQASKSLDSLAFYLAVIRCGAVYQPLNTAYTLAEIDYFLRDAEPKLLVVDADRVDLVQQTAADAGNITVVTLEDGSTAGLLAGQIGHGEPFVNVVRGPDDLAAILYTSGTTGRSKGAMLTHENLYSNAHSLLDYWQFSETDCLIHALPVFHTHGLFVATNVTLLAGSSLYFLEKFSADAVIGGFAEATCLMGVPTFYTRLLESPRLSAETAGRLRLFVSGSAPLLAETHARFKARTGQVILERYGMTETNMNTSNPYDGERRPGTVGFALPNVAVRICDAITGRPVEPGIIGSIEVRGPNVFAGYWRMPEKTKQEFRSDGFFVTGDLGQIDRDGYLIVSGRDKDMIISGGFNIYPKEIETELDQLEGVSESAVIGAQHADFGEGVVAVIVREAGSRIEAGEVIEMLGDRLAKFKLPKHIEFTSELPRNTMGKVQKNKLRDAFGDCLTV
jgi:malonyl-CoA/methylmalonyl-CoA synthetase